jgi:FkbM family methyltransferase
MIKPELYPVYTDPGLAASAESKAMEIRLLSHGMDFHRGEDCIRISHPHLIYAQGIIDHFDLYHSAVEPTRTANVNLVDYSRPAHHRVRGWPLMPLHAPSFLEPITTTLDYLPALALRPGDHVLDLGAYAGQTAITFAEHVGPMGRVQPVDADPINIASQQINFDLYARLSGIYINAIHAAIWSHDQGLEFSSEGNMGSSAVELVGMNRGLDRVLVPSYRLSSLVDHACMSRVDVIKCDIEGAETEIFGDSEFFGRYRPRTIMVETHWIAGTSTALRVKDALAQWGYNSRELATSHQVSSLPLLLFTREGE